MNYENKIKKVLSSGKDELDKKIEIIAIVTSAIEENLNIKPVVVGGQAVEFYTTGGYSTMDIDIICESSIADIDEILSNLGFTRDQKYWVYDDEELELAIEVPSGPLAGDKERITKVHTPNGHTAYFIGIEDILIDRLNAYVHWKENWQEEWILGMMILNYDEIDWNYIQNRAKNELVEDNLNELKFKAKKVIENDIDN